jgi:hypothetical protein
MADAVAHSVFTFGAVKTSGWGHHDWGKWGEWKNDHRWDGRGFHDSHGDRDGKR